MARGVLSRKTAEALYQVALRHATNPDGIERAVLEAARLELSGESPLEDERAEQEFNFFWQSYPKGRRVGKAEAKKLWLKLRRELDWPGFEAVMNALWETVEKVVKTHPAAYYGDESWHRFVPHPSTWLNQRRYLDG